MSIGGCFFFLSFTKIATIGKCCLILTVLVQCFWHERANFI